MPERCLAVEDSRNGLLSSLAAGIPTLVTVSAYTADQNFPGALAVLDHLGEPDLPCRTLAGPAPPGTRGRPRSASGVARRRVSSARKNLSAARQHGTLGSG